MFARHNFQKLFHVLWLIWSVTFSCFIVAIWSSVTDCFLLLSVTVSVYTLFFQNAAFFVLHIECFPHVSSQFWLLLYICTWGNQALITWNNLLNRWALLWFHLWTTLFFLTRVKTITFKEKSQARFYVNNCPGEMRFLWLLNASHDFSFGELYPLHD